MSQTQPQSAPNTVFIVFIVALACYIAGRLDLITITHSHIPAISAATGVALASILLCGNRALLGVFVGSICLPWQEQLADITWVVSLSFSIGITSQTYIANILLQRFMGPSIQYANSKDLITLLLIGGPFACLVSSTISITALFINGIVTSDSYPINWLIFWLGSSVGVVTFTPLLLLLFSNNIVKHLHYRLAITGYSSVIIVGLLCAFFLLKSYYQFLLLPWGLLTVGLLLASYVNIIFFKLYRCRESLEGQIANKARELEETQSAVDVANRAKTDFLSGMAHELRTPLNSIIGFSHRIIQKMPNNADERITIALGTIEKNGQHLLFMVNKMLDLSKIESGEMKVEGKMFNLPDFIEEIYAKTERMAKDKDLNYRIDIADSLAEVYGDPYKLSQILLNLISNAIKYTSTGEVSLTVEPENRDQQEGILFVVKDTGVGIPIEAFKHLFKKFQQIDNRRSYQVEGTGIGLALASEMTRIMQGMMSVDSMVGRGSNFYVWLPLTKQAPGTGLTT